MIQATWLAGVVESVCNGALALDPEVRARLATLDDKVIAVDVTGLDMRLHFLPSAQGLQVLSHYEDEPDTVLRGAPLALLRLILSDKPADELFAGGIELRGDTAAGQQFQDILRALDVDWEELLARVAGDDVAHQVGRMVRGLGKQANHIGRTAELNMSEYLHEETRLVVGRDEVNAFLDAVDMLRGDGDRLEARLRRLESAVADKKD